MSEGECVEGRERERETTIIIIILSIFFTLIKSLMSVQCLGNTNLVDSYGRVQGWSYIRWFSTEY